MRSRGQKSEVSGQPATQHLAFSIDRSEATAAKRSMQTALELVKRVRTQLLPGPLADALDQTERQIVVGITVLRDADRVGNEICSSSGIPDSGEKALKRRTIKPKAQSLKPKASL